METEQRKRIEHMESIMERAELAVTNLQRALEAYQHMDAEIDELESYYESSLWRQDFDDDRAGKIPQELKRGVLSEDGVWNLLTDRDAMIHEMRKLSTDKSCEEPQDL